MREILFRGKRCDNGEWAQGYYIRADYHWHKYGIHKDWIALGASANGGWFALHSKCAVKPETVGQYTGLTDKNGKKIFEGDMLKDDWGKIFEVIFTTSSCGFMVECIIAPSEFETGRYRIGDVWCNTISVIGNIYDNPELLKGDNVEV